MILKPVAKIIPKNMTRLNYLTFTDVAVYSFVRERVHVSRRLHTSQSDRDIASVSRMHKANLARLGLSC